MATNPGPVSVNCGPITVVVWGTASKKLLRLQKML